MSGIGCSATRPATFFGKSLAARDLGVYRSRRVSAMRTPVRLGGMDLTFDLVDDLSFAASSGRNRLEHHLAQITPLTLAPLVEYVWLRRTISLPSMTMAIQTALGSDFQRFAQAPHQHQSLSMNSTTQHDFSAIPAEASGFTALTWTTFLKRMQFAAKAHGFGDSHAAGLVGACGEMASNALEHSRMPDSAIAAFRTAPDLFEFVVADAGVGATASLRSCPEYSDVHDSGEALALCIREGVSRFGPGSHRGMGFHFMFSRLADLNARVRIRSDDQVIELRGDQLGPRLAILAARPLLRGFLVAVQCFPRNVPSPDLTRATEHAIFI